MSHRKPENDNDMKDRPCPWKGTRAGFTLIEVLVALVIISVGLLGLAGLQSRGLQDNKSAVLRSVAVQSAADMLDRMRANRAAALNGHYDITLQTVPPAPNGNATMAEIDLFQWKTGLTMALPSGNGSVARDGDIVIVEVRWRESGRAAAADDQTVSVVTRL